jgi:hypothetical protein
VAAVVKRRSRRKDGEMNERRRKNLGEDKVVVGAVMGGS